MISEAVLLVQIVYSETLSQLGRYQQKDSEATQRPIGVSNGDEKIDLVKRMLHKTRHIRRQNRQQGRQNNNDPQQSLTLDPRVIQKGSTQDGKEERTQAPSLISKNNFINFCIGDLAKGSVTSNAAQTKKKTTCNPIPMGMLANQDHLPSCKFVVPKNMDTIKADTTFRVDIAMRNLVIGVFTNPAKAFMSAPAQIDRESGALLGHSHLVITALDSINSTSVADPLAFFFFKGIDDATRNGIVSVEVKDGLPKGHWKFATINTASNHQPIGATLAQHAQFDDIIYITSK
ncbi:hypothetical protein PPACK8108_LOCUS14329 [Phakopsora pachyrhizi]|uniref:Uncharacterized protein n=1 Tax=Phakopsora pachyrhizi TaxID=170000 RepID=A0AAV0B750_PHAPC|nr:hypothetical protein PPACK8108_LOCUS14329 [Phakopsora pachyrhizi]